MSVHETRGQRIAARDRAVLRSARRARERVSLSAADIDLRIESAIIEAVIARGTVSEADLVRANIPRTAITQARFTRCFDCARLRDPAIARIDAPV